MKPVPISVVDEIPVVRKKPTAQELSLILPNFIADVESVRPHRGKKTSRERLIESLNQ